MKEYEILERARKIRKKRMLKRQERNKYIISDAIQKIGSIFVIYMIIGFSVMFSGVILNFICGKSVLYLMLDYFNEFGIFIGYIMVGFFNIVSFMLCISLLSLYNDLIKKDVKKECLKQKRKR